jgi:addiction module HigA family antidote
MRMSSVVRKTIERPSVDRLREPPTHPGEILLEEFLRPQGTTQVEAARHLNISTTRLNEIIRGKRGITADTAWRLGDWLRTGPEVWMNLQSKWDLWHARWAGATA